MTGRAAANPDVRTFSTTVSAVDGDGVVLEETYFYPEGGGQPPDRGTIDGIDVVDVQRRDGRVVHELAESPTFEGGDAVDAAVDDRYRTFCMRAHTASHLLYGAGRHLLDDLGYGGFDIAAERSERGDSGDDETAIDGKVRVDFATSTDVDDGTLVELERSTNWAVWDSRAVSWEELPRDEALAREEIAFNTKTEEGLEGETVRVVTIEGWDVAACGGTHVRNTIEVGPVAVLGRSNPGEGLTRVEFTVGEPAIDQRAAERERLAAAASALDAGTAEVPEAVARLADEREQLRDERNALRDELLEVRIAALREDLVERKGVDWLVGSLPGLDANELAERAQSVVGGDGVDVVAFVDEDGEYLAVATTGEVDAGGVVDSVTDEFGGGGGGGPTVAQGGGLDADPDALVSFLRE